MQEQVDQMKESINNIQQYLQKWEDEQKVHTNCDNLLPDSIIHEHVYEKPSPTPKITSCVPNITRTEIYTPSRHHLDDTEMKKILRDEPVHSHHRTNKKEKSSTAKIKYIYDGPKLKYVPPLAKTQSDYGHFVVQVDKKRSRMSQSESSKNYVACEEYGAVRRRTPKKQKSRNRQVKTKASEMTKLPDSQSPYTQLGSNSQQWLQAKREKTMKSRKAQCNIRPVKIKEPFKINWKADTDSSFSSMEI